MVSLLGPPRRSFRERSEMCRQYWDAEGNWIAATPIPNQTTEMRVTRLQGRKKDIFLGLVRKMLRWLPEERSTAEELTADEFLMLHDRSNEQIDTEQTEQVICTFGSTWYFSDC
ncbi:617cd6ef-ef70-444d-9522-423af90fab05 [Sclerotinia trifoliorum]|uniref:617cd6ef-ef70-444d-9522-423af90fab05 n=1 Tax=Sclerotinia trifoliorum TaxID=28548 RepID=A0A8H2W7E8_9HELO|nr:617cd6ef-ef70-444d-9522-423af90fab05 [Sclerotinia trifoliorum]